MQAARIKLYHILLYESNRTSEIKHKRYEGQRKFELKWCEKTEQN